MRRTMLIAVGAVAVAAYGCAVEQGGVAGPGYGYVDNRPCAVNFSAGGGLRTGRIYRTYEDFLGLAPAAAHERIAAVINSSGYWVITSDQKLLTVTATPVGVKGGVIPLYAFVTAGPRGGARVELQYNPSGGPTATGRPVMEELCRLLGSVS
jgi:hypothetical protein